MRTPVLAIARFAVHILVWSVASVDRVQRLCAIVALEALAMPFAALAQYLLCSEHNSATTRAALTGWRLNLGRIDDTGLGCQSAVNLK